jgi:hypothetical protein
MEDMLAGQIRSGTAHAERVPDPNAQHPLGAEVTQLHPERRHKVFGGLSSTTKVC